MKKLKALVLLPLAVVLLFSSCTVYTKTIAGMSNVETQVQFRMEDLEYIGDVSGTADQSFLLGFIPIGNRRYHVANIGGGGILPNNRLFNNALYDALMQRENADFVLP